MLSHPHTLPGPVSSHVQVGIAEVARKWPGSGDQSEPFSLRASQCPCKYLGAGHLQGSLSPPFLSLGLQDNRQDVYPPPAHMLFAGNDSNQPP